MVTFPTRVKMLALVGLVTLGGLGLAGYIDAQVGEAQSAFRPRPLIGASREEIGQHAVDQLKVTAKSVDGAPQVVLTRPVTTAELPALGLQGFGTIWERCEEPPLVLVVLQGDFDVTGRVKGQSKVKYVAYVYDLSTGMAPFTAWSGDGTGLKKALNDPSQPDDPRDLAPAAAAVQAPRPAASPSPLPPPGSLLGCGDDERGLKSPPGKR